MIERSGELQHLEGLLARNPVVGILGPRQVGKTTLARMLTRSRSRVTTFDLEDPVDLARLDEPSLALRPLRGLVVIDEVQRRPDLFPLLRVLADRRPLPARFLLLGSASPELLRQSSESLAGRIAYHELRGFGLAEVGPSRARRLWVRGGLPRSFTARSEAASLAWRSDFVRTFVERDAPGLGIGVPSETLRRFWAMLAHLHGQLLNFSELARAFAVSDATVRRYADALSSALVLWQLRPFHENLAKRQVKAPKLYVFDSGILHALLGIGTPAELERHPKVGASWEGFALGEIVRVLGVERDQCWFWRTHTGAELDLLVMRGGRRLGFELKLGDAPRVTPSMRSALADLRLDHLWVVHAGATTFPLGERITALPLTSIGDVDLGR